MITGQRPWNKFLLREAMRDRIREIVHGRVDKMGFPAPVPVHRDGVIHSGAYRDASR